MSTEREAAKVEIRRLRRKRRRIYREEHPIRSCWPSLVGSAAYWAMAGAHSANGRWYAAVHAALVALSFMGMLASNLVENARMGRVEAPDL